MENAANAHREFLESSDPLDKELGFRPLSEMSIDEKIDESLKLNRELAKAIVQLARNPMFSAMGVSVPGLGKR